MSTIKVPKWEGLGDRVAVKLLPKDSVSDSIIADAVFDFDKAQVVSLGLGVKIKKVDETGNETIERVPFDIQVGDTVLIPIKDFPKVSIDGVECSVMFEGDIEAII